MCNFIFSTWLKAVWFHRHILLCFYERKNACMIEQLHTTPATNKRSGCRLMRCSDLERNTTNHPVSYLASRFRLRGSKVGEPQLRNMLCFCAARKYYGVEPFLRENLASSLHRDTLCEYILTFKSNSFAADPASKLAEISRADRSVSAPDRTYGVLHKCRGGYS